MLAMRGMISSTQNGSAMITWPISTAPRPSGTCRKPRWNRISSATPSTTVGTTSGSSSRAEMPDRNHTLRRASGKLTITPSTVASTPQALATLRLFISAARISWSENAARYHFIVRPASGNAATVESLNENTISSTVGTYRKIRKTTKNVVSARLPPREKATEPPPPRLPVGGALGRGAGTALMPCLRRPAGTSTSWPSGTARR